MQVVPCGERVATAKTQPAATATTATTSRSLHLTVLDHPEARVERSRVAAGDFDRPMPGRSCLSPTSQVQLTRPATEQCQYRDESG